MTPRHFLATDDWSDAEVRALLDSAAELKVRDARRTSPSARPDAGAEPEVRGRTGGLEGKVLGMVFFNPSLRTRASFEVAMLRHGGNAITLEPGKGVWAFETRPGVVMDGDAAEHLVEAAGVLGRYVDALGVRAFPAGTSWKEARKDGVVKGFAEHAGVPVINLESARRHPCQGLADALTVRERLGGETGGRRFVLAWCYHPKPLPTAVPTSALIAAARLGMEVVAAHPPGFELDPDDLETVKTVATRNGGTFEVEDDLDAAVAGADVVYGKSWGSLARFGDPAAEAALRAPFRSWRIDEERMRRTRRGRGTFLHCLPVRRNVVVTDGVLDGPWSAVVDQAENRLHAQRALLLQILGGPR
jgi:N-acetylornithine carbamoyltransferase